MLYLIYWEFCCLWVVVADLDAVFDFSVRDLEMGEARFMVFAEI